MSHSRIFGLTAIFLLSFCFAIPIFAAEANYLFAPDTWKLGWSRWFSFGRIALSPDGKLLAVAYENGDIALYQTTDKKLVKMFKGPDAARQLVFSPDGKRLAICSGNFTQIRDVRDGSAVRGMPGVKYGVYSIAYSPDGQWFAMGSDSEVRLYRISDMGTLYEPYPTPVHVLTGHTNDVEAVAFSPDSKWLASGSRDKTVRLWRVADGQFERIFDNKISKDDHSTLRITSIAFSPDGTVLATATSTNGTRLWRIADGTYLRNFSTPGRDFDYTASAQFSPDGKLLAIGSECSTRLWRLKDGTLAHTLTVFPGEEKFHYRGCVCQALFSPDGTTLVIGSPAKAVQFWNVNDGTYKDRLDIQANFPDRLAFSPDEKLLAVANLQNDDIQLWQLPEQTVLHTLSSGSDPVMAFSPDGQWLASIGNSNRRRVTRLWRVQTGALQYEIDGPYGERYSQFIAFSADSQHLIEITYGSYGPIIYTRSTRDGTPERDTLIKRELNGHAYPIGLSANGEILTINRELAVGGRAFEIRKTFDGQLIQQIPLPEKYPDWKLRTIPSQNAAISPDGRQVALGVEELTYCWQLPSGKLLYTVKSPHTLGTDNILSLAFSSDGKWLATTYSSKVYVWRASDGQLTATLSPWNGYFHRMLFSPHGKWLACAGNQGLEIFKTSADSK
ncbi:MAG: WD40 repeat domain-containing protein [Armatimonadota bacterium]